MPSPKSEQDKAHKQALTRLLMRMREYVSRQFGGGEAFVVPKLAAAALGINDGEAFVLLRMLADSGELKTQYNIYCGVHGLYMQSVDTLDALGKIKYCEDCDKQHEPHEYEVEIAFGPVDHNRVAGLAA